MTGLCLWIEFAIFLAFEMFGCSEELGVALVSVALQPHEVFVIGSALVGGALSLVVVWSPLSCWHSLELHGLGLALVVNHAPNAVIVAVCHIYPDIIEFLIVER